MRVVALLASHNEERFIGACLDHLILNGVEAYLIDNESTDRTVEIAEEYRGRGLIGIETFPRNDGVYSWAKILSRKEELTQEIEADWFMHMDPDEIRLPHRPGITLAEAFEEVDSKGYNAVNFTEFTFVPTKESPDHDHPDFQRTMKSYYPFKVGTLNQIKAWKSQRQRVTLTKFGGHKVLFDDRLIYPETFKMRHYQILSKEHFILKYLERRYNAEELKRGWHGWRARLSADNIELPSEKELNVYATDEELDFANPRMKHVVSEWVVKEPESTLKKNGKAGDRNLPIVIGGCHRSGTSLVRRIVNSHSRIYCGPEVKFFRDFHGDYLNDPIKHGRFMASARRMLPQPALLETLGEGFVKLHERAAANENKPRWADKNPENAVYLDGWKKLLGDEWVFVHVVRNPLDTLASIKEIGFPFVIPPDLDSRIEFYKRYAESGLDFGDLHPDRYHLLIYDRLVENPAKEVSAMMEFLEEEFEPGQLDFNSQSHQRGLEDPKVRDTNEVHKNSVERWREAFDSDEVERIRRECEAAWRRALERAGQPQPDGLLRRIGKMLRRVRSG